MLPLHAKLAALSEIYAVYDGYAKSLTTACRRRCARCCTSHVTLTTLEGYRIIEALGPGRDRELLKRLTREPAPDRFRPRVTFNQIADLCARGTAIDAPEPPIGSGPCPLLETEECPVYTLRPFGCRCMVSRTACSAEGAAEMDPFTVSVNTLFMQTIEHIDSDGYSGNLQDVLRVMASDVDRGRYAAGALEACGGPLIANRPLGKLFLPPEHREGMAPIFAALQNIHIR